MANFPQAAASWTVSLWTRSSAASLATNTTDFSTIISDENQYSGGWEIHLDNRPSYGASTPRIGLVERWTTT